MNMKTRIVLILVMALSVSAQARFEPAPTSQRMAKRPAALKMMALPSGQMVRVTAMTATKVDSNLSVTVFPNGYWQKAARTNSLIVATETFASGLVHVSRVFTNQTGSGLIHVPRKSNGTKWITMPMLAVPAVQPYSFQYYWVLPDPPFPNTFNSDWQGFTAGTFQFQVLAYLGVSDWRSLGQFTLTDPVDPTISEGFDCPIGPPQNFLPLANGFVRVVKLP